MPIMSKPSAAPYTSLSFITVGVVMAIPSGVWYAMFHPAGIGLFFSASLFFLGLAFLLIGLSVGYIGRSARQAELPPAEVMGTVARQDQTLANRGAAPVAATVEYPAMSSTTATL